jgi:copper oxidase (laccase) domain-containing protein
VDLKGAVMSQLLEGGIPPAAIDISPLCTISEAFVLHSYRRDGAGSGRMMGITGRIR